MDDPSLEILPITDPPLMGKQYDIHPNLPDVNKCFNLLVVGACGVGKTLTLANLLTNPNFGYSDVFGQNVYIISATCAKGDPSFRFVYEKHKSTVWGEYDDAIVQSILDHQSSYAREHRPKALLVFDDFLNFQAARNAMMFQVASMYRHYNLCLIYSTQLYKGVPPLVRQTCTDLIVHANSNEREREKVGEEMGHRFGGQKAFDRHWALATKDSRHDFMYCQLYTTKARLFKNFTTLMVESDDAPSAPRARGFDGAERK